MSSAQQRLAYNAGKQDGREEAIREVVKWLRADDHAVRKALGRARSADKYTKGQQAGSPSLAQLFADAIEQGAYMEEQNDE